MRELETNKSLDQGPITPVNGVYVSLVVIDGGYTYSDAHQFYSQVTNVVPSPQVIPNAAVNGRVFSGNGLVFTNVIAPSPVGALVLHRQNSGASSTWRLVLYEDTGIIGLPLTTNGGNIVVSWNAQGIFGL